MIVACVLLAVVCVALAASLARTARAADEAQTPEITAMIQRIDALLPQTQCGQCNFIGCRPYAAAIATGGADIDQCPPGGQRGVDALAQLLGRASKPLNPAHGVEAPRTVALIDEAVCIGCTKCIQVCPVDAILGAPKLMHTVIAAECTGCGLCLPPCPVDCISLPLAQTPMEAWGWPRPAPRI
ncbi:MAG: RnfABCDGE type electron transport complex subunit B [Tahibacter sp.]